MDGSSRELIDSRQRVRPPGIAPELGNAGCVGAAKIAPFMATAEDSMAQDAFATPQEPFLDALLGRPARQFSATRAIGGKLRALYDDAAQPCPDRVTELLAALKIGSLVAH
jgi:hypothetical protein